MTSEESVSSELRPIRCLAIVNRGEAAMRCIRAVKSLRALEGAEIRVVALYTPVDKDAPFVRHADVARELVVRTTPVGAYLDHDLLLAALRDVGADAVWPGWGFVAESPTFVDKLEAAGIRFLGPKAGTMRALGDKIASKLLAERVDVPVTEWSGGEVDGCADALAHAKRIGFPVVIKASAGGGGRGIRVVRAEKDFEANFTSAQSEAISAFGDGRMFVEAMVQGGRHIEVQIIADTHGNVVALGCRDCSVQRRHQKVLEEAPPSGLPPLMFQALKESAVALAREVGYSGAGTVEFLVDGPDFFFLEMNPRLQVEHGITEEITSSDLVQLQIRVARGEHLPALEFRERGFSIEARVCAEDPDAGFLPAPGRIGRFDPALGPRLRIDTGVAVGSTVPADFDSLIAKVIATGDTREEARARLVGALRDFDLVIEGGATNKGYLLELLEAQDYRQGNVNTTWLDRYNEGRKPTREYAAEALMLAAILSFRAARRALLDSFFADAGSITQDKTPKSGGLEFDLTYLNKPYRVAVYASGADRFRVHLGGRIAAVQLAVSGAHAVRLKFGEHDLRALYDVTEASIRIEVEGTVHQFGRQMAGQVRAKAPSMVVALHVSVGQKVQAGQSLGLLEAMKMEIGFDAPIGGVVTEIRVRKGQQVAAGEIILNIDPSSEEEPSQDSVVSQLVLPEVEDRLELFFGADDLPDVESFAALEPAERRRTQALVVEEVRRCILGYDIFEPRIKRLTSLLEADLPEELSDEVCGELASVRAQLGVFLDIERPFTRSTRHRLGSGELDQLSNNALMRLFVRRLRANGSGLPERFLDVLKLAVAHYDGVVALNYSPAMERAVVRMFASQLEPEHRFSLIRAIVRRVVALSRRVDLSGDSELKATLQGLISLRGHVPHSLADACVEASYVVFQRPLLDAAAARTQQKLEEWLLDEHADLRTAPSVAELAQAPNRWFARIYQWFSASDPRRRAIALSTTLRRLYGPRVPSATPIGGADAEQLVFDGLGTVCAAVLGASKLARDLSGFLGSCRADSFASEVFVPLSGERDASELLSEIETGAQALRAGRLTVTLVDSEKGLTHYSYHRVDGEVRPLALYEMHPEAAERVDLGRYESFTLERLPAPEGVYCFHGKARAVPDDERLFVLAEVRDPLMPGVSSASAYLPAFERVFHEAAQTMRLYLGLRDPRRRLQWNRLGLFIAQALELDEGLEEKMAQTLYPATRHLGLERVSVQLPLVTPDGVLPTEFVITDTTGSRVEIQRRSPHRQPLVPVEAYQRSVVAARRRGLLYPYEIISMLAPEVTPEHVGVAQTSNLPPGRFEEYDLDPSSGEAVSVAGRPPGQNVSSVVFGVITTQTAKVPEGMKRVLLLSDPTRGMGALAAAECDRVMAAIDLAERLGVPVEWLPVSSGARIAMDSGTENLDATARVVRRIVTFTQNRGAIHIIVAGVNVGAQSYWDSLATMLGHTRGILIMTPRGSMVLTGRAALAASGSVSAEDELAIGGYERVMGPNGQAQYYAEDLGEAYRILYQHYDFTYVVPGESRPRPFATTDNPARDVLLSSYEAGSEFGTIGEIFDLEANPGRKRPFSMRALMRAVADADSPYLERWPAQTGGETAIVWDSHLGGHAVSLIGIESQNVARWGYRPMDGPAEWNGGTLFPTSSKKVARALNACSGNRPAVVLANLSGFDGSPESMRKLQLEYGAEIARAVVNFEGPLVFLVVSRYHGGAYVVFSRELNSGLRAFAVEGSYASVIGGGPAAAVVFPREVSDRVARDERVIAARQQWMARPTQRGRDALEKLTEDVRLEKQAELAAEFDAIHSVDRAQRVGSLEGIIDAKSIRPFLIGALSSDIVP